MGRKRIEDKHPEILPLLGTMTDKELAEKYNCVPHTIFGARKRHGIAPCGNGGDENGSVKSVLPFPTPVAKETPPAKKASTSADDMDALLDEVAEVIEEAHKETLRQFAGNKETVEAVERVIDDIATAAPVKNVERDSERKTILRKKDRKESRSTEAAATANKVFLMTSKVMENGSSAIKCYPFQSLNGIKVFGEGDPRIEGLASFNTLENAQEHLKKSNSAGACKVSLRAGVREWGRSAFDWPTDEEDAYTAARRKVQKAVEKGSDVSLSAIEVKSLFGRMVL